MVSFSNFYAYLTQFKVDLSDPEISDPARVWGGDKAMTDIQEIIQANPDIYRNVFSSPSCKAICNKEWRLLIQYEKLSPFTAANIVR